MSEGLTGRLVEQTPMRAAISRRMSDSQREVPHFYVSTEVSTARLESYVQAVSSDSGTRVSTTAALVRACAVTLAAHRQFNAVWTKKGLMLANEINLGVAIALDDGLLAPALMDCGPLDLLTTASRVSDLVDRARARKLRPVEMTSATFTLSNLGPFDVSSFAAIVTPPQVGILAVGQSKPRVIVGADGAFEAARIAIATLSADHRAVDGADAARFLESFKTAIENPESLSGDPGSEA